MPRTLILQVISKAHLKSESKLSDIIMKQIDN
jgi:hypothetical protein